MATWEVEGPLLHPQLGTCRPFWCPPYSKEGVSCWLGWQPPRPGRVREGASCADMPPSTMGVEDLGSTFSGSWGGGLDTWAEGAQQCLLAGGWALDTGEWHGAPLRSLYKPSASEPATASSTFWRLSVSKCWASSCSTLAQCNKCSPSKRREGSITKIRLRHKTAKEQLERSSNTKQKEIPALATPEPHF